MKKLLVILCSLAILTAGCTSGSEENGSTLPINESIENSEIAGDAEDFQGLADEIKFFPTYTPEYKTGSNTMFDFWFDIPSEWSVTYESLDDSSYRIISDNDKAGILIYGLPVEGSEDSFYNSLKGDGGSISDFIYRDGWSGKRIDVSESEMFFVRLDGDSYIVLHIDIKDDGDWLEENIETLDYIASSIRITRESYGGDLGGENQITLDDLQLGEIKLGMTYEELLVVLEEDPIDTAQNEYEGLIAETLFFQDDTQILLVDNIVYSVNVIVEGYSTSRGLQVGDSEAVLLELYGEPNSIDEGNYWNYAYDGYELLSIRVDDGKVVEIQIDVAM